MPNDRTDAGNATFGGGDAGSGGGGGGAFPGFGGAPPQVATASSAGGLGTASRSDHTHGLDILTYTPSTVGMQAAGVIQQTFPGPTAVPAVLTMVAGQIPFGVAGGTLTQSPNLTFANAATAVLTVASTTTSAQLLLNNVTNNQNNRLRFAQSAVDYFQIAGARNAGVRTSVNVIVFNNVAATDRFSIINDAGTITPLNVYTGNGDCGIGLQTLVGLAATNGFAYLPIMAGAPTVNPTPDAALGARLATVIDNTDARFYCFTGGGWHFAEFADFTPTYNSVTAQAATGLTLVGNATSNWQTSAGGIVIRANTGGVLGTTSTQISMSAGTAITVVGNLTGAVGSTLGTLAAPWDAATVTQYNINNGGVSAGALQSGGLSLTAAATQSLSKSGGLLFVQTTDANDVVFRSNGAESFRISNATNVVSYGTGAGLTAAGAIAVAITNAPAGVGAAPAEYLKVLGTAGATRYIPLLG